MTSPEHLPSHLLRRPTEAAVVIGLDSITGLQTSRLLAGRGVPVVGLVADRKHWGARTRACVEVLESPLSGPGLLASLRALAGRSTAPAVLFPCTDPSVATVSRHREELGGCFLLPLAPHAVVEMLTDKVTFAAQAAAAGLRVPRVETPVDRTDAAAAADDLVYPCVVKPRVKSSAWLGRTRAKGFLVEDREELLAVYDRTAGWSDGLLVQEWVEGPEDGLFSCNAYFGQDGEPLATFVARKIRQWPPAIGTSASGEECRNDEVLDATLRLFGGVGYRGLAYLEMKLDMRTNQLMAIEANVGRPTGRSAIAEQGGVELVHTAYCDAVGLPLPRARQQRYLGARWVDVRRDLQAAAVARRQGTLSARDWVRWMRGPKAHAIWSMDDPVPFVVDVAHAVASGTRMLLSERPLTPTLRNSRKG